ncbi:hypothetical protein IPP75_05865 [Candidatus Saccharibacteria bacterium]|nr:MAG: hypothetical protein IPP75_05865 [Candidatus Saccharibacteria bacterium]
MLQLQALNRSPEIAAHTSEHGRSGIIIVGSTALALYKVMLDMPLTLHRISVSDLDICVPDALQNTIRANDWRPNRYRGVITFRQEIDLSKIEPKLRRPVQIDADTTVGTWSYGEAHEDALIYPGDGEHPELTSGYAVLHPSKQLEWYQQLSRVKDGPRITFLQTHIIPRLGKLSLFKQ